MNKIPSLKIQSIWNSASGLLSATEAIIMNIVVTRFINLEAAGELTIAFALGNLFRTIGLWGMRNYQVSDQKKEFNFFVYLYSRYISIILMFAFSMVYLFFYFFVLKKNSEKIIVISLILLAFVVDCFEDVIWGDFQRNGRIDIGAKLFLARWSSYLFVFTICTILFRNLIFSLLSALLTMIILFVCLIILKYRVKIINNPPCSIDIFCSSFKLLKLTLPIFIISYLIFFMNNVAKYSIDFYFNDEMQACFGFIALPGFTIEMFSAFIYQPKLVSLSNLWIEKYYSEFLKEIFIQLIKIIFLTIICSFLAWVLGVQVLSRVFATELYNYRLDLLFIMFSGGAMSLVFYGNALLTLMRKQYIQLVLYCITTVLGGIFIWLLVFKFGIRGGSIGNMVVFFIQAIVFYLAILLILFNKKNNKGDKEEI